MNRYKTTGRSGKNEMNVKAKWKLGTSKEKTEVGSFNWRRRR